MKEEIKLIRKSNTVVNASTEEVVGVIEKDSIRFIQRVEGKVSFDKDLSSYLSSQKK